MPSRSASPACDTSLSDGTPLGRTLDPQRRAVSLRVCCDGEIYALELERLFARAWQCLAHASELDGPGIQVERSIGEDPLLLWRDQDGTLRCAWTWLARGEAASESKDVRLAQFAGFIFGTCDPDAPALEDYLGTMGWYLRLMFERTDAGLEVAGPPQRWRIPANWKLAADQFSGDAYHALTLHQSIIEVGGGLNDGFIAALRNAISVALEGGHGVTARDSRFRMRGASDTAGGRIPPPGVPAELMDQVDHRLDEGQRRFLAAFPPGPSSGHVFPNMSMLMNPIVMADGRLGTNFTVRCWLPRGPGEMEVCLWCLVEKDAPAEFKERVRHTTISNFSVSGTFEQDDAEAWVGIQRGLKGSRSRQGSMTYTARRTEADHASLDGVMGPLRPGDKVFRGWPRDERQWRFWMRWLQYMEGDPWAGAEATSRDH